MHTDTKVHLQSEATRILTFVPPFPPTALQSVETTVVHIRKNFQKAVLSIKDTGPKDETTALP